MAGEILSMTGFGAAQLERTGFVVRAEIRTVNHRHLQVRLRLPNGHHNLEPQLEGLIKKTLQRGSVQLSVHLDASGARPDVRLRSDLAKQYVDSLQALANGLHLSHEMTLAEIAGLPGVLEIGDAPADPEQVAGWIEEAVRAALDDLLSMRQVEGAAMVADLRVRGTEIEALRAKLAERSPQIVIEQRDKLRERINALLEGGSGVNEADIAREIALMADRLDVSEELARLQSHLDMLESLLSQGGPIGRKLDFLAQEFMREANTVGSKCSDAESAHQVVELKAAIERLREQIQNVE